MKNIDSYIQEAIVKGHISKKNYEDNTKITIDLKDTVSKLIKNKILQCGSHSSRYPMPAIKIDGVSIMIWKNMLERKAKDKFKNTEEYSDQILKYVEHKFNIPGLEHVFVELTAGGYDIVEKLKDLGKQCNIEKILNYTLIVSFNINEKEKFYKLINLLPTLL